MNNDLKGQHKNYAETGDVPGGPSFGAQPHNHRDAALITMTARIAKAVVYATTRLVRVRL